MKRLPDLFRSAIAVLAGLLLAGTLASPAAAEDLAHNDIPFELQDRGEDLCTEFHTAGLAGWAAALGTEETWVDINGVGWLDYPPPETMCLAVVPSPRHISFTAYIDREPVDSHVEPFDRAPATFQPVEKFAYEFSLSAPDGTPIDYVTAAICRTQFTDVGPLVRCGEPVMISRLSVGPAN